MMEQVQGVLSKSVGAVKSSGSAVKAFAGAHPVVLGIVVGVAAYYIVEKYWLNKKEDAGDTEAASA